MAEIIADNIYLILLLPLWVFLIVMLGRFFSVYVNKKVIHSVSLMVSALGAFLSIYLYNAFPIDKIYETTYPFIKINDFTIQCGIYIDKFVLIFLSVLFSVSFFVQLFSISYMKSDNKQYRFFALMNLFNFSLTGLFLSPNLYQTYVFWELASLVSYLLIGFEYSKESKSLASKKVFIINRIGDTAFLSALIMSSYLVYEYAPAKSLTSLPFMDLNIISILINAYASTPLFILICSLFIIAAVVKSAQFPFYTWLQDAMEAKLPVSALLHSATLVALGVYLLIRLTPFFTLEFNCLNILTYVGIITAIICSLSACAQINPKKALAYSTSAQLGLMFFAIGVLNIKAALMLFCAHAVIKSMLFITLPNDGEKWSYTKFVLFLIGGLSLSGILLSGMISKEILAYSLGHNETILMAVLSFLTAFYIIRIALVTANNNKLEKIKLNRYELVSAIGLFILNVLLYLYIYKFGNYKIAEPFWAAITACVIVYILHIKKAFYKIPLLYTLCYNGFYLDKFYMTAVLNTYNKFTQIMYWIDLNLFANYKPIVMLSKLLVKCTCFVETDVMNRTVSLVAEISKKISVINSKLQTGNVQRYNFYALIIISVILTCLIIAYSAVISYVESLG